MRSFPVALLVLAACGGPVALEPTASSRAEALTTTNGTNLNGTNLNGTNLNGTDPGATLAAVSLSAVRLEDKTLDATWLDGSMFRGQRNGSTVAGKDFVGAELDGTTASGAPVRVRIADVLKPADGSDVWRYAVEFADAAGTWQPLCPASGTPRLAIPVQGRWDYRQGVPGGGARIADDAAFTFGCEGAAIAKCVLMGYRPWASFGGADGVALHQACVRLIRADYCGDGLSHTTNGRTINLYDGLGIQERHRGLVPRGGVGRPRRALHHPAQPRPPRRALRDHRGARPRLRLEDALLVGDAADERDPERGDRALTHQMGTGYSFRWKIPPEKPACPH